MRSRSLRSVAFVGLLLFSMPRIGLCDNQRLAPVDDIPISTQLTLDAAGVTGRAAVGSVFMIVCPNTGSKGTGVVLRDGWLLTCAHVIRDCQAKDIIGISCYGKQVQFQELRTDSLVDLAVLKPVTPVDGGLELESGDSLMVGTAVTTWGYPLGYNGPSPLLSVGYLAGFAQTNEDPPRLVVNGAFNPGNSGGPLFRANSNKLIGIVVSKHAPISQFQVSAIEALAENKSGVTFTAKDGTGKEAVFVESQIVANLLEYFHSMTQVMIGEAISEQTISNFLRQEGL